jgi:hypothetical protein
VERVIRTCTTLYNLSPLRDRFSAPSGPPWGGVYCYAMTEELDVLKIVGERLDASGIPYMLTAPSRSAITAKLGVDNMLDDAAK